MNDSSIYKPRLYDYLIRKGISIENKSRERGLFSCIAPGHQDNDPSCSIYFNSHRVNCNSCGFKGDIFDCAGALIGSDNFNEQLEDVKTTLGEIKTAPPEKPKTVIKKSVNYVSLTREEARKIYTDEKVLEYANFALNRKKNEPIPEDSKEYRALEISKFWPYYNSDRMIDIMVVRFEHKKGKDVLTYYYDGKNLKMKNYPVLLYNRDKLAADPEKPVLFHEGEKCCDYATNDLPDFVHVTWNGGGKKVKKVVGFDMLAGRKCYILPDDDQKIDKKTGDLLPKEKQPGYQTALDLKNRLRNEAGVDAVIVPFIESVREIKSDGADIVEILQVKTPDEITEHILRGDHERIGKKLANNVNDTFLDKSIDTYPDCDKNRVFNDGNTDGNYPFQILGIADDNRAYFLDYENRMISHDLPSLTDKKLIDLAGLTFFKSIYGCIPSREEWLEEIDNIMQIAKRTDFDIDSIRGRGAWRDNSGNICYHDGQRTTGKYDKGWTFVRRPRRDIGIFDKPCEFGIRQEIMNICKTFSFATDSDAVRLLAWSTLAPFGGALKWRPAILVTGESGTGKSTVLDNVSRPISAATAASGTSTTEAGIRQYCGIDSNGVSIDEAEKKKQKDKERMDGIFSLMRGSTTDDAPRSFKGTLSGYASTFQMRSMFLFAAIDPTVDDTANDNRIIRVNFRRVNNFSDFTENLKRIKELLTRENCRGIRAFTWKNLSKIIDVGARLEHIIQKITGQDARFSAGESILLACNLVVWDGFESDVSDDFLIEYVSVFYRGQTHEDRRDETQEMIDRLLDETVRIDESHEKHSLREMLTEMKLFIDREFLRENQAYGNIDLTRDVIDYGRFELYRKVVEQHGLTIHKKSRELFIAQNHHVIMRILEVGKGYHRQIERHKNVIERSITCGMDKTTKRGVVIGNILGDG